MNISNHNIRFTFADRMLDATAFSITICSAIYTSLNYSALPDVIPTHFGASGTPDGYGSKAMIWLLVGVSVFTFSMLMVSEKYPQLINYPFEPKNEIQKELHIKNAYKMVKATNLFSSLLLGYIIYGTIQTALGEMKGLSWQMMVALLVSIFALVGYFIYKGYQISKNI